MVRWRLKSCPRCGSDMYMEKDFETVYEKCLMCSYTMELERIPVKQPVGIGGPIEDIDEDYLEDDE